VSSGVLDSFIDDLEMVLEEFLDAEIARVENERDFLLKVLEGRADGVTVEDVSTELTMTYLSGYLSVYMPIEEDVSASSS
jgi:hypothetical protein